MDTFTKARLALIQDKKAPVITIGDKVRVHLKITDVGDKERIQIFEGTVIAQKRSLNESTFTVRKVSYGVGVERIFPLYSPRIDKVEVVSHSKVRRAKLYYLRELKGKESRLKGTTIVSTAVAATEA